MGPFPLLWASLSAALVSLAGAWLLAERLRVNEEWRRERRAFAEAVLRCCDALDDLVVRYWGAGRDEGNWQAMGIVRRQLTLELEKILGLVSVSRLSRAERDALRVILDRLYEKMLLDFDSCPCPASAARVGDVVEWVTRIRLEVNKLRAG